jgi:hypothetical protein
METVDDEWSENKNPFLQIRYLMTNYLPLVFIHIYSSSQTDCTHPNRPCSPN